MGSRKSYLLVIFWGFFIFFIGFRYVFWISWYCFFCGGDSYLDQMACGGGRVVGGCAGGWLTLFSWIFEHNMSLLTWNKYRLFWSFFGLELGGGPSRCGGNDILQKNLWKQENSASKRRGARVLLLFEKGRCLDLGIWWGGALKASFMGAFKATKKRGGKQRGSCLMVPLFWRVGCAELDYLFRVEAQGCYETMPV